MSTAQKSHKITCIFMTLSLLVILLPTTVNAINSWTQQQVTAHEIAELARSLDLPEDNPIIVEAKRLWQEGAIADAVNPQPQRTFTDDDAVIIAKIMYSECRGIPSDTEKACLAWVVLNRVSAGYGETIAEVATAPAQFGYSAKAPVLDDLLELSYDVLTRWDREKNGETDVGRVLPIDYLWYSGDGVHNYFRNAYCEGVRWSYSLISPYKS